MSLRRGTTLAELLVAVVFLGLTSSAILTALSYCSTRTAYAKRRAFAFENAKAIMDQARANATGGTISNFTSTKTLSGVPFTFKLAASTSGATSTLTVSASWQEPISSSTRAESMAFTTVVTLGET